MSHPLPDTRRSRAVTKLAATAAAATLAVGLSAAPAAAEGAVGKDVGTTLFNLELEDGTVLKTYCIDFETPIRGGAEYQEDDWANYPGKGEFSAPAKVHWVLQHSYPSVDIASLAEQSKVSGLDKKDAVAGTQAAIWHFSNGIKLKKHGNDSEVKALYDYLVENAVEEPQSEEPEISLSITPAKAEGEAGKTVGPFLLESSSETVSVKLSGPEGIKLVDSEGNELSEVASGTEFGVMIPEGTAPGQAEISASVSSTELHMGRLFKGTGKTPTQTLITAETSTISSEAAAKVTWTEGAKPSPSPSPSDTPSPTPSETPDDTPSPSPSETPDTKPTPSETPSTPPSAGDDDEGLPVTGAALGGLVAAAVAALGAGAGVMYLSRKRRSSSVS
ncbi:thioester domain-containing protein [Streptomonospora litoralis]|uniref:Thioester domain-containing protein n=1 Tax=Streptomonospora litoralis TaxID=2498135 RepID=A0A4P6Q170_9ACTN|nr:thioester domain-containing protein [Streptomonospora litoralis]QBI52961.1 hypothetical protein EKD16_05790 [Streptomonospora litoralis]